MATLVFTNAKVLLAQYDIGGDLNQVSVEHGADPLDVTTFGATTRTRKAGLRLAKTSINGFWDANSAAPIKIDDNLWAGIGNASRILTVSPAAVLGDPAYTYRATQAKYAPGGKVGDMLAFSCDVEAASSPLVRGTLFLTGAKTITGTSAIYNTGAAAAAQFLYAALHVTLVSGTTPTLDVTVKSAATGGFGTPTTRITFAQQTVANSVWATPVAGAITDAFWRVDYTIGGTTPSFTFVIVVGIV